jgi:hypothetical protein
MMSSYKVFGARIGGDDRFAISLRGFRVSDAYSIPPCHLSAIEMPSLEARKPRCASQSFSA